MVGTFGPTGGWLHILLWPIYGQFNNRWGEGWVSNFEKYFFALAIIIPYLITIFAFIKTRKFVYFCLFLGYLLWSIVFGYARYHIPVSLMTVIYFVVNDFKNKIIIKKYIYGVILLIFSIICFVSYQTDFAWRPSPYARVDGGTQTTLEIYINAYKTGLSLVGHDKLGQMAKYYRDEFVGYDAIMPYYRGWSIFYAYLGSLNGLRVFDGIDKTTYNGILADNKISDRIKRNLDWSGVNSVMLVTDKGMGNVLTEVFNSLEITKEFTCVRLMTNAKSYYFQTDDYFSSLIRYKCVRKT